MKFLRYIVVPFLIFFIGFIGCAQVPDERPKVLNPEFDEKISRTISFSVPTIGVDELATEEGPVYIFDAREWEEFEVSHIPNAEYIGYNNMNRKILKSIPKDAKVVLYCSIGYRSEKIGEKLQKQGFTNVHNLYGSIFEWVNQGNPVVDKLGNPTEKVHTYNRKWSQWITEGKGKKVW